MTIALKNGVADAMLNAVVTYFNDAGGSAELRIYTAAFASLLATFTLTASPFGAAGAGSGSNRKITIAGLPLSTTGAAAGTAAVFRMLSESGLTVLEGTVTATGGGGDLTVDNTSIASGQTVNLTGGDLTLLASLGA